MSTRTRWTRATALAAGSAFLAREGCLPDTDDFRLNLEVPHWNTLRRLFGSLDAYLAALPQPPAPPLPPPRRCLGPCNALFQPAHKDLHVCDSCKQGDAWQEEVDVDWMNGEVGADWWEDVA